MKGAIHCTVHGRSFLFAFFAQHPSILHPKEQDTGLGGIHLEAQKIIIVMTTFFPNSHKKARRNKSNIASDYCFLRLLLLVTIITFGSLATHSTLAFHLFYHQHHHHNGDVATKSFDQSSPTTSTTTTVLWSSNGSTANPKDDETENNGPVAVRGVTLKLAFDEQWGVAELSADVKSERFTCSESLDMVHRLRRCSDAVLVGRSTVEIDDCSLTVRRIPLISSNETQPTRVIIDPRQQLILEKYQIAKDGLPTIVYYNSPNKEETKISDQFPNVCMVGLPPAGDGKLSATEITKNLQCQHNIHHIMVEGGVQTAKRFLDDGVVDRAIIVQAPIQFQNPLMSQMSSKTFEDAGLELVDEYTLGVDRISLWSRPDLPWPSEEGLPYSSWP